jgi:hypothetical protein
VVIIFYIHVDFKEKYMVVFKCNKDLSGEEWERWQEYIEDCWSQDKPIMLPEFIDLLNTEEGEEIDFEEE